MFVRSVSAGSLKELDISWNMLREFPMSIFTVRLFASFGLYYTHCLATRVLGGLLGCIRWQL